MEQFNRIEEPKVFSEEDLVYLKALLGTTRTADGHDITFVSILSIRELVILYNVAFDGVPAVAKVAIRYQILESTECIVETLCYEKGIHLEDQQWSQEEEKWLLTDEQTQQIASDLEEALKDFRYANTYVKDVYHEADVHSVLHDCESIPRYYGLYECDDVVIYVIEKLGSDLFSQKPSLEVVAIDVIKALQCLHNANTNSYVNGYFHNDVTPGNILNDNRGGVTLIDFGVSRPIWFCGKPGESPPVYSLKVGNPCFAPSNAFLGCYNYASDLEGLCYTLEFLYHGPEGFPWKELAYEGEWKDEMSERAFLLRQKYTPSNERVRKLFEYIQTIGNEKPDYRKCMEFFM